MSRRLAVLLIVVTLAFAVPVSVATQTGPLSAQVQAALRSLGLSGAGYTTNQCAQWNGSKFVGAACSGGGGGSLASLSDVTLTSPADGQPLGYDSGSGKWVNLTTGATDDVVIGAVTLHFVRGLYTGVN